MSLVERHHHKLSSPARMIAPGFFISGRVGERSKTFQQNHVCFLLLKTKNFLNNIFQKRVCKCSQTTFFLVNSLKVNALEWLHFWLHFAFFGFQSVAISVAKFGLFPRSTKIVGYTLAIWLHLWLHFKNKV